MTPVLSLPREVAAAMLAHARAELPNEACGLVSGSLGRAEAGAEAGAEARAFHPARNAHASPLRYDLHPEDLVRLTYGIDAAGEDVVAVFHSHTATPAVPSASDLREATHPEAFYLIVSLAEGGADAEASPERAMRAWRIRHGEASEVEVRLA